MKINDSSASKKQNKYQVIKIGDDEKVRIDLNNFTKKV